MNMNINTNDRTCTRSIKTLHIYVYLLSDLLAVANVYSYLSRRQMRSVLIGVSIDDMFYHISEMKNREKAQRD